MRELTADNASEYLVARGRAAPGEPIAVRELTGGVSNAVLLVELTDRGERNVPGGGLRFVLKQARGQLRVKEEWLCPIERIWREVETLRICGELLALQNSERRIQNAEASQPSVPAVLWEDRENYCFAMTAAPPEHRTWKELLLAGELADSVDIAKACGRMLATLHGASWGDTAIAANLDDRTFFDQLRIDPYYRHVAKVHPDLAPPIQQLIDSVWSHRPCLVHGDFSPKNLLVWHGHVMLIDCEVGHYGDPAFDLGFFLTHLVLKAISSWPRRLQYMNLVLAFWNAYRGSLAGVASAIEIDDLEHRAASNLAGCLLARVDGKSPVDYLTAGKRKAVRELSRRWIVTPPHSLGAAAAFISRSAEN